MSAMRGTMSVLRRFPILYGVAWSLFWAVLGMIVVALLAHQGDWSDRTFAILAYIIHGGAIFIGAMAASRAAKERGWYYGGLTGLLYAVFMILISFVAYNTFSMDAQGLFRTLVLALVGAFGGMIGVNTVSD